MVHVRAVDIAQAFDAVSGVTVTEKPLAHTILIRDALRLAGVLDTNLLFSAVEISYTIHAVRTTQIAHRPLSAIARIDASFNFLACFAYAARIGSAIGIFQANDADALASVANRLRRRALLARRTGDLRNALSLVTALTFGAVLVELTRNAARQFIANRRGFRAILILFAFFGRIRKRIEITAGLRTIAASREGAE